MTLPAACTCPDPCFACPPLTSDADAERAATAHLFSPQTRGPLANTN